MSIVQGPFPVAPCQTPALRFATFSSRYGPAELASTLGLVRRPAARPQPLACVPCVTLALVRPEAARRARRRAPLTYQHNIAPSLNLSTQHCHLVDLLASLSTSGRSPLRSSGGRRTGEAWSSSVSRSTAAYLEQVVARVQPHVRAAARAHPLGHHHRPTWGLHSQWSCVTSQ